MVQLLGCVMCPKHSSRAEDVQNELNKEARVKVNLLLKRRFSSNYVWRYSRRGKTTGTPISLMIYNQDQKSRNYRPIRSQVSTWSC